MHFLMTNLPIQNQESKTRKQRPQPEPLQSTCKKSLTEHLYGPALVRKKDPSPSEKSSVSGLPIWWDITLRLPHFLTILLA